MNRNVSSTSSVSVGLSTKETDVKKAPLMYADRICKTFDIARGKKITALDAISLKIFQGRVTGLVGADGAGKTTLIRIAAGLLVPTEIGRAHV